MRKRSGLALLFAIPVLALGACGGDSDKDKITEIIEESSTKPEKTCENITKDLLKQLGGEETCKKAAKGAPKQSDVKVNSVKVDGDKATAKVTSKVDGKEQGKDQPVNFVKEDGDWKIATPN